MMGYYMDYVYGINNHLFVCAEDKTIKLVDLNV